MSQPQEIIVYRSPVEYQLYNSPVLFPVMCSAIAAIVAVVVLANVIKYLYLNCTYRTKFSNRTFIDKCKFVWNHCVDCLPWVGAIVAAIAVYWQMTS